MSTTKTKTEASAAEVLATLKSMTFALESVINLAGSRIPPAAVWELSKYVSAAKAVIENNGGAK
jgi:hypothetical protein